MASQPFGLLEREALLGRLEVERQHLVVPRPPPLLFLATFHTFKVHWVLVSSGPAAAAKRYERCSGFLPDKYTLEWILINPVWLCRIICTLRAGARLISLPGLSSYGQSPFVTLFKRMSNFRHTNEEVHKLEEVGGCRMCPLIYIHIEQFCSPQYQCGI